MTQRVGGDKPRPKSKAVSHWIFTKEVEHADGNLKCGILSRLCFFGFFKDVVCPSS
jgi:hypothetical protein